MVKLYDAIIIGAGIAGLTAAIYASREKRKFEIISADFGGQFLESGEVYNYPGIIETTGVGFNSVMQEQMKFNNICSKFVYSTVDDPGRDSMIRPSYLNIHVSFINRQLISQCLN